METRVAIRPRVVGLIPAAGAATRLGRLPCSKELLPIGLGVGVGPPEVAIDRLLRRLRAAGVGRVVVAIRDGKWDIPAYLAAGRELDLDIAYVVVRETRSILDTLRAALPFVENDIVALGFPDILFEPDDLFDHTLDALIAHAADAVLAAVPTDRPDKADVLDIAADGTLRDLTIKPRPPWPRPAWTWIGAAWAPSMTRLLLDDPEALFGTEREPYPGDLIREAIARGLDVRAVTAAAGRHLDIGTSEDLARAVHELAEAAE